MNTYSVSTQPDDRASSRAQRAAARRAQLLEAARKVVLRHGLERARIADIVAEVGGSQGLAHYHFPSREALLVEMLRTTAEDDVDRARQIVRDTGTAVQRLDRLIRLALPISSDDWNWRLWVEMWVSGLRHDEIALISEQFDTGWSDTVRELLEEGVESGVVRCADPTATADRLSAMINGLGLRMVSSRAGFPRAYVIRLVRMAAALELGMDWQEYLRQGQEG
ncbi:TetR/AcrR family transcriptional regulator [Mycolicibacterium phlei]